MANRDGRRGGSGTDGGTDVEPLRGGMKEASGEGRAPKGEPAAPYHGVTTAAGGLAPHGATQGGGTTSREGTPPDPGEGGESARGHDEKIAESVGNHEREGANAPREEPQGNTTPRA
jgi:hypothetical protein